MSRDGENVWIGVIKRGKFCKQNVLQWRILMNRRAKDRENADKTCRNERHECHEKGNIDDKNSKRLRKYRQDRDFE